MHAEVVWSTRPSQPENAPKLIEPGVMLRLVKGTMVWAMVDTDSMYGPVPPFVTLWHENKTPMPFLAWNVSVVWGAGIVALLFVVIWLFSVHNFWLAIAAAAIVAGIVFHGKRWRGYVGAKIFGIIDHYVDDGWIHPMHFGKSAWQWSLRPFVRD